MTPQDAADAAVELLPEEDRSAAALVLGLVITVADLIQRVTGVGTKAHHVIVRDKCQEAAMHLEPEHWLLPALGHLATACHEEHLMLAFGEQLDGESL